MLVKTLSQIIAWKPCDPWNRVKWWAVPTLRTTLSFLCALCASVPLWFQQKISKNLSSELN